jgi:protein-S-isoprenylcysteine O-methyltransferase Ste14
MPHEEDITHLIGHIVYIALYGLLIVFSILFYNSANLVALLYVGWITLVFGIISLLSSSQSRKKGRVTEDGISKETLVESGLYRFIRHPEFFGHILIILALILIAQHLLSLIIGVMLIVLLCFAMVEEEKRDIDKFGNAYRDYMHRVPRINLLVGFIKPIYSKKGDKR